MIFKAPKPAMVTLQLLGRLHDSSSTTSGKATRKLRPMLSALADATVWSHHYLLRLKADLYQYTKVCARPCITSIYEYLHDEKASYDGNTSQVCEQPPEPMQYQTAQEGQPDWVSEK
jgi:hypothetical protein